VYQTTVNNTYEVVYYYEYIFDCGNEDWESQDQQQLVISDMYL
jgi:hypothetical protein